MIYRITLLFFSLFALSCSNTGIAESATLSSSAETSLSALRSSSSSMPKSSLAQSSSRLASSSVMSVVECKTILNVNDSDSTSTYLIASAEQFSCWNRLRSYGIAMGNVELTSDIHFSAYDTTAKELANGLPLWSGVRSWNRKFEGNGHIIYGLFATPGIFDTIQREGSVQNLTIRNSYISWFNNGYLGYAGSFAAFNRGIISNCHVDSSLILGDVAGGIAGSNTGLITNSSVKHSRVSASTYSVGYDAGGIAGRAAVRDDWNGIMKCFVDNVVVMGVEYSGGIVGKLSNTYRSNFHSNYTQSSRIIVNGSGLGAGGIVGELSYSSIGNTFTVDTRLEGSDCGGISGGRIDNSSIYNSYSHKNTFLCYPAGGIMGSNLGSVHQCYADTTTNLNSTGKPVRPIVFANSSDEFGYSGSVSDSKGISPQDFLTAWILDSLNEDSLYWTRDSLIQNGYPIFPWMTEK